MKLFIGFGTLLFVLVLSGLTGFRAIVKLDGAADSPKIELVQEDTKGAVQAMGEISTVIHQINEISTTIASAVEEQAAATNEMGRNVGDAAKGAGEIASNISGVAEAARNTASGANETQIAAGKLAEMAAEMQNLLQQFKLQEQGNEGSESGSTPNVWRLMLEASS